MPVSPRRYTGSGVGSPRHVPTHTPPPTLVPTLLGAATDRGPTARTGGATTASERAEATTGPARAGEGVVGPLDAPAGVVYEGPLVANISSVQDGTITDSSTPNIPAQVRTGVGDIHTYSIPNSTAQGIPDTNSRNSPTVGDTNTPGIPNIQDRGGLVTPSTPMSRITPNSTNIGSVADIANSEGRDSKLGDQFPCLRPYLFHGLDLVVKGGHGVGDCPFCGREGKFSVDVATGLWRCLVCATGTTKGGGNALVFVRLLHERSVMASGGAGVFGHGLQDIADDRRLLDPATVAAWGVCWSWLDKTWLVPGYGTDGKLDQVYRRTHVQEHGQWVWRLLPTPGVWPVGKVHGLHLPASDFDPARAAVVVCEGPWDGMALWEVGSGVWGDANVIAVPGCNVWRDEWTAMCRGKQVTLLFDSDHPRVHGGRTFRAGYDGMVRIAKKLSGVAASVRWLKWGPEGWDESKPSGWDVRDHLSTAVDRQVALVDLIAKVEDAPMEWVISNPSLNGTAPRQGDIAIVESQPCYTWSDCEASWDTTRGGALRWRQDMSDALAVLLAVCASTQQGGNQLFLQLVGSAGSGKTTMCDGLLVSRHCHHLEHLTGFHSGWKGEDGKDCSLIARINGKTLITPEADVLMSSPRFQEIMGQQRRIFDGKSAATYKNTDQDMMYSGLRTPWIMAGTPAMMDHDQSHLGDRFLRFIIGDPSESEKREILRSALKSERVAMLDQSNGTAGSIVDPKTRRAHALTGGYVDWLRANVEEQLAMVDVGEAAEDRCIDLAELSADLRARPNDDKRKKETHDTKELPTRLARQNVRLASCLAVVLNRQVVDMDVLRIVRKVAMDTAFGHSLNIVQWLASPNPKAEGVPYQECGGLMIKTLAMWSGMTPERLHNYLMFLRKIDVLQWQEVSQSDGSWTLTERMYDLYLRVMED